MKRMNSCILTLCLAASISLPTAVKAETSGRCGDNLTYMLDNNGILTISGTGAMYDDMWSFNHDGITGFKGRLGRRNSHGDIAL